MAPQNAQQFTTAWAIRQERAFGRETKTVTNGQKKLQMGVSAKKDLRIWEGGVACSGRVRVVGATRRDDLAEARSGLSALLSWCAVRVSRLLRENVPWACWGDYGAMSQSWAGTMWMGKLPKVRSSRSWWVTTQMSEQPVAFAAATAPRSSRALVLGDSRV